MADELQEALAKAAASPDSAVRHMAIEYREMLQKFDKYAAFFEIYKQGVKLNGSASAAVAAPAARAPLTRERMAVPRPRARTGKDDFSDAIRAILTANGGPMKLNAVYSAYQESHPNDQTISETFRQRLVKRPAMFTSIQGQGWWLTEATEITSPAVDEMAESA